MKTLRDILLVGIGGYIGWYLAMNEEKAVRKTLNKVQIQAIKLKEEIAEKIKENEKIQNALEKIKDEYTGISSPDMPDVIKE
tara:strand:+ start:91 stop:336 length:246 start_codon:yes stop_codon:yes gene_type:complete